MEVIVKLDDFYRLIDLQSTLELVAAGFDFVEGPVWHPTYKSLLFSDILGNSLYSWRADVGVMKRNRHSYMANGNAYDHDGRLLTCEHATSRLTRTDLTNGTYEVLATHYQGKQLNSPNDVIVKQDGTIYFTDPPSGRSAGYGIPREQELPFNGVYRLDPANSELTLLIDDFAKPNGLCFSQDESLLYISDTTRQNIRVFEMLADGGLGNSRLFANLVGDKPGVADGLKIDSQGNVYSCGPGGIHIFTVKGDCLGIVETPEPAANFVFGDDDLCSLYITATTSLYRLRVNVPGVATYLPKPSG
ncbi:SMP-30/gluconolactonase/LRE family protein [Candidatus Leptofilum sp.]|uniref:SMP-30/gluconolactonase/LRE family protein n=1 Tax=Candidatus Leptofilum sp. TaxID=3241576 RepID=UPI003B5C9D3C